MALTGMDAPQHFRRGNAVTGEQMLTLLYELLERYPMGPATEAALHELLESVAVR